MRRMPWPPNSAASSAAGPRSRRFAAMPLPSLFRSRVSARPWNVAYAALCGSGIGALAGLLKTLNPFRPAPAENLTNHLTDVALAAFGFALLCAVAAALRNFIARHLIWHDDR